MRTGLLRTRPEVKAHRVLDDLATLRRIQLDMLRSLWPVLKPGGELLYTTCSILKAENDLTVKTFLKRNRDAQAAELPVPSPGKGGFGKFIARRRQHGALLFLPSESHQGGYVALLRKAAS